MGSRDGSGLVDLDVDMDDVAALKASKICDEGLHTKQKKNGEGHFEMPSWRGPLHGVKLGLRHKKENFQQATNSLGVPGPSGASSGAGGPPKAPVTSGALGAAGASGSPPRLEGGPPSPG